MKKLKETQKVKVFLFAPAEPKLTKLLAHYNNVRVAKYVTANTVDDFIRVRVRKRSNSVSDIAKQFANVVAPIMEYKVGEGQGDKVVATIRIPAGDFDKTVEIAKSVCEDVWRTSQEEHKADAECPEIFFTCRVSNILARDETPWIEIFAVQKHAGFLDAWKKAVEKLAEAVGHEAVFHDAGIVEYK